MHVLIGNTSASNDPKQIPHDATEQLLKGAKKLAAGAELGLSEEETLAATSRQYRRQQQREAYRGRTKSEARWLQTQNTLRNEGFEPNMPDKDLETDLEVDPFGQNQDDFQNFSADDRGFTTDEETGELIREPYEAKREDIAPKSAIRDALVDLQTAKVKQQGFVGRLASVFGEGGGDLEGAADIEGRLEDYLQPNLEAERSLARDLVIQDSRGFSQRKKRYNDVKSQIEAEAIARENFGGVGSGNLADDALGRIAEIRSLGRAGETSHRVVPYTDGIQGEVARRYDGIYIDPRTGDPVAVQGPELPAQLMGSNTPNTNQQLNAPSSMSAQDWVAQTRPDYRQQGRTFGDYPQADITLETTNFSNRLRELKGFGLEGIGSNVRSVEELQRAVDYIVKKGTEMGKKFYSYDQETGKNVPSTTPGTPEVMNLIRMSQGDQERLANALYQLQLSSDGRRAAYQSRQSGPTQGIVFDAAEAINPQEGQAEVARIRKGSKIEGKDIVSALAGLSSPGAQKPFIGQVAGQKPRIDRRKPRGMGEGNEMMANIRRQAVARSRGKGIDEERVHQNQVKARLAEEREKRDRTKRQKKEQEIRSYIPAIMRRRIFE